MVQHLGQRKEREWFLVPEMGPDWEWPTEREWNLESRTGQWWDRRMGFQSLEQLKERYLGSDWGRLTEPWKEIR
jgi:hypothetical protein